jgi:hypothetical protein
MYDKHTSVRKGIPRILQERNYIILSHILRNVISMVKLQTCCMSESEIRNFTTGTTVYWEELKLPANIFWYAINKTQIYVQGVSEVMVKNLRMKTTH